MKLSFSLPSDSKKNREPWLRTPSDAWRPNAVVSKGDYRLDLFHGSPDDPQSWTYIRSFKVGLGTGNSTPLGNFVVRPRSKLVNPPWVNPQTGQKFGANDPKNPIGEYWLGLEGIGESKTITGYGIHGTDVPTSIGTHASHGCVRVRNEDIETLFQMVKVGTPVFIY